ERATLLSLYDKGKKQQWDAATRIDWSQDLDPENPQEIDDRLIPIFGSALWDKLTDKEKVHLRHHQQAQTVSQFMHGEQGALMAAARIVQTAPDLDAKFYAATQVMDEARHVEAYARLLNEKLGIAYPITPGLKSLLETVLTDRRWDMTYLGMQILIEGLALAAFQRIRDFARNRLAASVNAYVMQDIEVAMASENMRMFRKRLFSRIVPTVKDIGLWGPGVQKAFADMGAIEFAEVDSDALLDQDNRVAEEFDAGVFVRQSLT